MQSKASIRFRSHHPLQHKLLVSQMNSARLRKERQDSDEILENEERENMQKNWSLMKFREEDREREIRRKHLTKIERKISWSRNLIEIQVLIL